MSAETTNDDAAARAIFNGDEPIALAQAWLKEAEATEPNDPNAIALATSTPDGLPNVRMVLLKEIEPPRSGFPGGFVFYTNFDSAKGGEIAANAQAAFVMHWKSLRRQVRVRGRVERVEAEQADAYYRSRAYQSRLGAWASQPVAAADRAGPRWWPRSPRSACAIRSIRRGRRIGAASDIAFQVEDGALGGTGPFACMTASAGGFPEGDVWTPTRLQP